MSHLAILQVQLPINNEGFTFREQMLSDQFAPEKIPGSCWNFCV